MENRNCMILGDICLDVSGARIEGYFGDLDDDGRDDCLIWGVVVDAFGSVGGRLLRTRLTCERLFVTSPGEVRKWTDLAQAGQWQFPENDDGEPQGLLYLGEHLPVLQARWRVYAGTWGGLSLEMEGTVEFSHGPGLEGVLRIGVTADLGIAPLPRAGMSKRDLELQLLRLGLDSADVAERDGVMSAIVRYPTSD